MKRSRLSITTISVFAILFGLHLALPANATGATYAFELLGPNTAKDPTSSETIRTTGSGSFDTSKATVAATGNFARVAADGSLIDQGAARFSRALISFAVGYVMSYKTCSRISLNSCRRVCSRAQPRKRMTLRSGSTGHIPCWGHLFMQVVRCHVVVDTSPTGHRFAFIAVQDLHRARPSRVGLPRIAVFNFFILIFLWESALNPSLLQTGRVKAGGDPFPE